MRSNAPHLLIVEDDPDHAELIELAVADAAERATWHRVSNGEAALEYLNAEGEFAQRTRPNLVLLDLRIPRISGHEVAESAKANERLLDIPIVMLTTSNAAGDLERAWKAHVNGYVVKPLDPDDFHRMLVDLVRFWTVWNEVSDGS